MHRLTLKYLLLVLAALAAGCDVELLPSPDGHQSGTVIIESPDAKDMVNGDAILVPAMHGKEIKSTWRGKVVSITDGDTIKVLNGQNEQVKVRLESIDTPERKQPFGEAAKDLLGTWVHERTVVVKETGQDRYGRTLAFIELPLTDGNLDICREMVRMGYAWHYVAYSKSETLGSDEEAARNMKLGLWAGTGPDDQVPPWEWRREHK